MDRWRWKFAWNGTERARKQNDFCFLFRRFFLSSSLRRFIDHRRERQCSYARSAFLHLYFDLRHFDREQQKKVFFSFRIVSIPHNYVLKMPVHCRHSSSSGNGSRAAALYRYQVFVDVRCGATGSHYASVRYTFVFSFGIVFIIHFFHLSSRGQRFTFAHVTPFFFFLKAIIQRYWCVLFAFM